MRSAATLRPVAPLQRVQALSTLANLFADYLPLSLHLVQPGKPGVWHALAPPPGGLHPVQFEIFLKTVNARYAYHVRCQARSLRSRGPFEAEHRGLWDSIAPTGHADWAVFAGPYQVQLPEAPELKRRFGQVSGGRKTAPEVFAAYARAVLNTPVLPPEARQALGYACSFAAQWQLDGRGSEAEDLEALKPVVARLVPWRMERFAESRRERLLWWAAQSGGLASWDRRDFGLKQLPGAVLALAPAVSCADPVDDLVLAAKLRSAAFHLAVERGWVAGRAVGEGACLLVPAEAKGKRAGEALAGLARDAGSLLSRRVGADLSVGWSLPLGGAHLPEAFRQAEWALLMALPRGQRWLAYEPGRGGDDPVLEAFEAGKALQQAVLSGRSAELGAAKEAALGSAVRLYPGRSDLLRPELLRLSLQLLDAVKQRALLDGPAWERQRGEALAGLQESRNARELTAAFGGLVDRLGLLAVSPRSGSARLRVQLALRSLEEQDSPPDLVAAAALAGLSPSRFSRLFARAGGEGYGEQRRRKRLENAAQMLLQGRLPVWRVAQECGYRSASHFVQAFQKAYGKTPAQYRKKTSSKRHQ